MIPETAVGGRLKHFIHIWKELTCDKIILQIVKGAKIDFIRHVNQIFPCKPIKCSLGEKAKIDNEVKKYLELSIIEKANHSSGEFVNQIFPRLKKSGGVRIILNLKPLNCDVEFLHFKMENLNSAINLMEKNCYMASIDLKDAYYSVNVDEAYRKYLRFTWNDQLYQFTCLPNGLTSAPRLFTKLMKPVFSKLRGLGLISVYYLDDTWLMGVTEGDCLDNVEFTFQLLQKTGFLVNSEKSQMIPSQKIQFLGFILNSIDMTVSLPIDKKERIISLCSELLNNSYHTIRFIAKVIGVLVSSLPGVRYGELFYRYLESNKIHALKQSAGNFDESMTLGSEAKIELKWWVDNSLSSYRPVQTPQYSCVITTDASKIGWGAVYDEHSTGGHWTFQESLAHINILELKAIQFGLSCFLSHLKSTHIRIRTDNSTAVAYINNLGGVKSLKCHSVAKAIWIWALNRDIHLSAEHLPGSENDLADTASRIFDENTEWSIVPDIFSKLEESFEPFSIDLFASRLNTKHELYISWKPDPSASFIDAFSQNWVKFNNFYAFPPFSLITKCIQKVREEEAKGVIITPIWPTQVWFPPLMRMLIAPPTILPKDVLYLPFKPSAKHKQSQSLRLMACHISGNTSERKDFQSRLSRSYAHHGEHQQLNSMKSIIASGFISAIDKKLIPINIMK